MSKILSINAFRYSRIRTWWKACAILVAVSFILPYLTWAFDAGSYAISRPHFLRIDHLGKVLAIPKELGAINRGFQGNGKTIVCIQDLHCNYEVQKNIAGMIRHMVKKHGLQLVGEEGAFHTVDTSPISAFPIRKVRKQVSDYFVRQGKITGAEHYSAISGGTIRLEGIETPELYQASRCVVRSFLNAESQGYCHDLRDMLDELKAKIYNPRLLKFDGKREAYRKGDMDILKYSAYLHRTARRMQLNLSVYPHLTRFLDIKQNIFSVGVNPDRLFQELDRLDLNIRQHLYSSDTQRELDELCSRLEIMEKLLNISVSPEELQKFRLQRKKYTIREFVNFINNAGAIRESPLQPRNDYPHLPAPEITMLDHYLGKAEEFYRLADERSHHFVDNIIRKMDDLDENLAVMINGGFHTDKVLDELKRRNITYISIKPRVSRQDVVNPYFELLQGRKTPLEKLLARNQTIMAVFTHYAREESRIIFSLPMQAIAKKLLRAAEVSEKNRMKIEEFVAANKIVALTAPAPGSLADIPELVEGDIFRAKIEIAKNQFREVLLIRANNQGFTTSLRSRLKAISTSIMTVGDDDIIIFPSAARLSQAVRIINNENSDSINEKFTDILMAMIEYPAGIARFMARLLGFPEWKRARDVRSKIEQRFKRTFGAFRGKLYKRTIAGLAIVLVLGMLLGDTSYSGLPQAGTVPGAGSEILSQAEIRAATKNPYARWLLVTEDVDALDAALVFNATQSGNKYIRLTIHNEEELEALMTSAHLDVDGKLEASTGALPELLQSKEPATLLLDFTGSASHLIEQFNSLFNDEPYFDKYKVPYQGETLRIIGAISKEQYMQSDSTFRSRFRTTDQVKIKHRDLIENIAEAPAGIQAIRVDTFGSPLFKDMLVGRIRLTADGQFEEEKGALLQAIESDQPLVLEGDTWKNQDTLYFIRQLLLRRTVEFNGKTIAIPEDFKIYRQAGNYAEGVNNKLIVAPGEGKLIDSETWIINEENQDILFSRTKVLKGKLMRLPGLLEKEEVRLRIQGKPGDWVWHAIMHSGAKVELEVSDHDTIPAVYTEFKTQQSSRIFSQDINTTWEQAAESKVIYLEGDDTGLLKAVVANRVKGKILYLPVTPETSIAKLTSRLHSSGPGKYEARISEVIKALQCNKTVLIEGLDSNNPLMTALATALGPNPYLMVNGKRFNITSGRLIITANSTRANPYNVHTRVSMPYTDELAQELLGINPDDFQKLQKLGGLMKTISAPPVPGLYPAKPNLSFDSLKMLAHHYKRNQNWLKAMEDVILPSYSFAPEVAAYIRVITRLTFEIEEDARTSDSIHGMKLNAILNRMSPPRQWSDAAWQLTDTLSLDLLEESGIGSNYAQPNFNGVEKTIQRALVFNSQGEKKEMYAARFKAAGTIEQAPKIDVSVRTGAENVIQLEESIVRALRDFRAVFFRGPPGVGKSYIAERIAGHLGFSPENVVGPISVGMDTGEDTVIAREAYINGKMELEAGPAANWIPENSNRAARLFVVDEANLTKKPEFWNFLESFFNENPEDRYMWVNGKRRYFVSGDRIIFTGNQESVVGRKYIDLIEKHFIIKNFPEFEESFLRDKLSEYVYDNKQDKDKLVETMLQLHQLCARANPAVVRSLRDLQEFATRVNQLLPIKWEMDDMVMVAWNIYSGAFSPNEQEALKHMFYKQTGVWVTDVQKKRIAEILARHSAAFSQAGITLTPAVAQMVGQAGEFLEIRQTRIDGRSIQQGKTGMINMGASGRGKDAVLVEILKSNGLVDAKDAAVHTPGTGKYHHLNASFRIDDIAAAIELAKTEGSIVIISEMNLLPSAFIEGKLNDILTGNAHPGFGLFATINNEEFGSREKLSSALLNRTIFNRLSDYSQAEFLQITRGYMQHFLRDGEKMPSDDDIQYLVSAHCWIREQIPNTNFHPTTRDLLNAAYQCIRSSERPEPEAVIQSVYGTFYLEKIAAAKGKELPSKNHLVNTYQEKPLVDNNEVLRLMGSFMSGYPVSLAWDAVTEQGGSRQFRDHKLLVSLSTKNSIAYNLHVMDHETAGHVVFTRNIPGLTPLPLSGQSYDRLYMWLEDSRIEHAIKKYYPYSTLDGVNAKEQAFADSVRTLDIEHLGKSTLQDVFKYLLSCFAKGLISEEDVSKLNEVLEGVELLNIAVLALKHLQTAKEIYECVPGSLDEEAVQFQQFRALKLLETMRADYAAIDALREPDRDSRDEMPLDDQMQEAELAVALLNAQELRLGGLDTHSGVSLWEKPVATAHSESRQHHPMEWEPPKPKAELRALPAVETALRDPQMQVLSERFRSLLENSVQHLFRLVFSFDRIYGSDGAQLDERRLAANPNIANALYRTGGVPEKSPKEIVLRASPNMPWNIINEELLHFLLGKGLRFTVYTSETSYVENIHTLAGLKKMCRSAGANIDEKKINADLRARQRPGNYVVCTLQQLQELAEGVFLYGAIKHPSSAPVSQPSVVAHEELSFEEQVEKAKEFLKNNGLEEFGRLAYNNTTKTIELYADSIQVSDISALADLTNLTHLGLSDTQVRDISVLAGLTNLTELYLNNTSVEDISVLAGLTNLTHLNISATQVREKQVFELFRDNSNRGNLDVVTKSKRYEYSDYQAYCANYPGFEKQKKTVTSMPKLTSSIPPFIKDILSSLSIPKDTSSLAGQIFNALVNKDEAQKWAQERLAAEGNEQAYHDFIQLGLQEGGISDALRRVWNYGRKLFGKPPLSMEEYEKNADNRENLLVLIFGSALTVLLTVGPPLLGFPDLFTPQEMLSFGFGAGWLLFSGSHFGSKTKPQNRVWALILTGLNIFLLSLNVAAPVYIVVFIIGITFLNHNLLNRILVPIWQRIANKFKQAYVKPAAESPDEEFKKYMVGDVKVLPEFRDIQTQDPQRAEHILRVIAYFEAFLKGDFDYFIERLAEKPGPETESNYKLNLELLRAQYGKLKSSEKSALEWDVHLHDFGYATGSMQEHEKRGAELADKIMRARGVPGAIRGQAASMIALHTYLGWVILGEIRISKFQKDRGSVPLRLLQLHNVMDLAGIHPQINILTPRALQEIVDFINDTDEIEAEFDTYRLLKMAKTGLGAQDLSADQDRRLWQAVTEIFGSEENSLRRVLKERLDVVDGIVLLTYELASLDPSYRLNIKFMKLLAQIGSSLKLPDVRIRCDIQNLTREMERKEAVLQVTKKLINILNAVPDEIDTAKIKNYLEEHQWQDIFGIPLSRQDNEISLKVSELVREEAAEVNEPEDDAADESLEAAINDLSSDDERNRVAAFANVLRDNNIDSVIKLLNNDDPLVRGQAALLMQALALENNNTALIQRINEEIANSLGREQDWIIAQLMISVLTRTDGEIPENISLVENWHPNQTEAVTQLLEDLIAYMREKGHEDNLVRIVSWPCSYNRNLWMRGNDIDFLRVLTCGLSKQERAAYQKWIKTRLIRLGATVQDQARMVLDVDKDRKTIALLGTIVDIYTKKDKRFITDYSLNTTLPPSPWLEKMRIRRKLFDLYLRQAITSAENHLIQRLQAMLVSEIVCDMPVLYLTSEEGEILERLASKELIEIEYDERGNIKAVFINWGGEGRILPAGAMREGASKKYEKVARMEMRAKGFDLSYDVTDSACGDWGGFWWKLSPFRIGETLIFEIKNLEAAGKLEDFTLEMIAWEEKLGEINISSRNIIDNKVVVDTTAWKGLKIDQLNIVYRQAGGATQGHIMFSGFEIQSGSRPNHTLANKGAIPIIILRESEVSTTKKLLPTTTFENEIFQGPPEPERIKEILADFHETIGKSAEWSEFIEVLARIRGLSSRESRSYHRYEHAIEVEFWLWFALTFIYEAESEEIQAGIVAGAIHDTHIRPENTPPQVSYTHRLLTAQKEEKAGLIKETLNQIMNMKESEDEIKKLLESKGLYSEDEVEKYLVNFIDDFRETIKKLVDINLMDIAVMRTQHPFEDADKAAYAQALRTAPESGERLAEILQYFDKAGNCLLHGPEEAAQRVRQLFRDEYGKDTTEMSGQEIAQLTLEFLKAVEADPIHAKVFNELPSWARSNWQKNKQYFENEMRHGAIEKYPALEVLYANITPKNGKNPLAGHVIGERLSEYVGTIFGKKYDLKKNVRFLIGPAFSVAFREINPDAREDITPEYLNEKVVLVISLPKWLWNIVQEDRNAKWWYGLVHYMLGWRLKISLSYLSLERRIFYKKMAWGWDRKGEVVKYILEKAEKERKIKQLKERPQADEDLAIGLDVFLQICSRELEVPIASDKLNEELSSDLSDAKMQEEIAEAKKDKQKREKLFKEHPYWFQNRQVAIMLNAAESAENTLAGMLKQDLLNADKASKTQAEQALLAAIIRGDNVDLLWKFNDGLKTIRLQACPKTAAKLLDEQGEALGQSAALKSILEKMKDAEPGEIISVPVTVEVRGLVKKYQGQAKKAETTLSFNLGKTAAGDSVHAIANTDELQKYEVKTKKGKTITFYLPIVGRVTVAEDEKLDDIIKRINDQNQAVRRFAGRDSLALDVKAVNSEAKLGLSERIWVKLPFGLSSGHSSVAAANPDGYFNYLVEQLEAVMQAQTHSQKKKYIPFIEDLKRPGSDVQKAVMAVLITAKDRKINLRAQEQLAHKMRALVTNYYKIFQAEYDENNLTLLEENILNIEALSRWAEMMDQIMVVERNYAEPDEYGDLQELIQKLGVRQTKVSIPYILLGSGWGPLGAHNDTLRGNNYYVDEKKNNEKFRRKVIKLFGGAA